MQHCSGTKNRSIEETTMELVEFKNSRGETLRGFFQPPAKTDSNDRHNLVIFPNGGLMACEGDFRAYIRITKLLNQNGYYVFRFNPSGLGTSDGNIEDCRQNELFAKIETGMFIDDIKSAVQFITQKRGFTSITLAGICGGAISSFLSSAEIKEVDYVIPIGMPIIIDSDLSDYTSRMPKEHAKFVLSTYFWKIFSIKAWMRFFTLKSDITMIKSILRAVFFRKDVTYISDDEKSDSGFKLNPTFIKAARKVIGSKKILFIFGNIDKIWWEFETHFLKKFYGEKDDYPFDCYLVQNANHMLTWVEMQQDAAGKILNWLDEQTNGLYTTE